MRRWAARGLDVTHRTSHAAGQPNIAERDGYRVIRRGSRYSVFPRAVVSELTRRMGESDALVELWNGVPWMSPVWYRRPHITVLHQRTRSDVGPDLSWPAGRRRPVDGGPLGAPVLPVGDDRDTLGRHTRRAPGTRVQAGGGRGGPQRGSTRSSRRGGARTRGPSIVAVARLAPRQTARPGDSGGDRSAATGARSDADDRRRRPLPARPRSRCRACRSDLVDRPARSVRRSAVGRPVPKRMARGQRLARRGMGAEPDGSSRLRHPVRRHRHPRATTAASSMARPGCSSPLIGSAPRSPTFCSTTNGVSNWRPLRCNVHGASPGRPRRWGSRGACTARSLAPEPDRASVGHP